MSAPSCVRCGRQVALRARAGEGRICSNCYSIASAAVCAGCGQLRRVAGRDAEGRACCEVCRAARRRRAEHDAWTRQVIDVVIAADHSLSHDQVRAVLAEVVTTSRSLRRLAGHLAAHPEVFQTGPTSLLPVLDRFTRALVVAGARTIRTIDPVCDSCGRRRPRHARNASSGGVCSACSARGHKTACTRCGQTRRVFWSEDRRERLCDGCRASERRRCRLDALAAEITALLQQVDPALSACQVGVAADRVAPKLPDRARLVEMLAAGVGAQGPARRHPFGARLLAELRAGGADLPGAVCGNCGQPADRFVAHGGVVRCSDCEQSRQRHRARGTDDEARQVIVDAVAAADSSLPETVVRRVLDDTVTSRRALLGVAARVAGDPCLFTTGPTTTADALDRLVAGLIAAGAQSIRSMDPACDSCGQRRHRAARTATGGLCQACNARRHKMPCPVCGKSRLLARADVHGFPICDGCVAAERRCRLREDLVRRVAAVVAGAAPATSQQVVADALDQVAPTLAACKLIVVQLEAGPALSTAGRRPVLAARFLAELRSAGAALPAATCEDCDGPAEPLRTWRAVVRCEACHTHCPHCDHPRARPTKGRCRWCIAGPPPPACSQCGRAPRAGLGSDGWCRQCRSRADHRCSGCGAAHQLTRRPGGWTCHRCMLGAELDERLGSRGRAPDGLPTLRAAMIDADNPAGVRRWLRDTAGGRLLAGLASGEVPLTHEALDDASGDADDRSIDHLRALLVATGVLPDEERSIERLERFFDRYLAAHVADPADRKVVKAWLRWKTLPRLRRRVAAGESMAHSANNARRGLHYVAELIEALHAQGRDLHSATQADIDDWFARPGANQWLARPFLTWAHKRAHLPRSLRLPDTPPKQGAHGLDDSKRWSLAHRLVNDDNVAVDDRVAAALVVIYAQTVTTVARLRTSDVNPGPAGTVMLNVGDARLPVHQPFAALVGQLPLRRTHGVTDQIDSDWLFPGGHAGKPVTPTGLANRMRAIGIEPRHMRNTARAQLATEIPPALLGKLIGVAPQTATRWANLTASNWTSYAAERATASSGERGVGT